MKCSILVTSLLLLGAPLAAQDAPLLSSQARDLLHEELSGELALESVKWITRYHRIQGSRQYRIAGSWVRGYLGARGFAEENLRTETYPSDGRRTYQTWQSPSGWDITSAELRLVEPVDERIVGFPEVAMSVVTYSNPGDVTAELVWVGAGTRDADYEGKDVAGKFVLATGYGGAVHRLAVLKYGAAAVVCYLDDERAKQHPDMLAYTGMWPRTDELERTTFGFNLTNRQGERLLDLLEGGQRVVLKGKVAGIGLEPFHMDVIVATIPGAELPDEEVLFIAHLDHPKESANDNASGSAAILDIARGLRKLIDEGRLPPPKRTLRFLWVPEWYGTMAYIDAHPELIGPGLGGKVLACMNLDMVGENTELLHSKLVLTRNPESLPSALDSVVANMAAMVDGMDVRTPRGSLSEFNYRVTPYAGGSDHMMLIDRKVPSVMFSHSPDYTHHTSEDTIDKVDPVQLERCELIAAGSLWYLANLTADQAVDLAWRVKADASRHLARIGRRVNAEMARAGDGELPQAWVEADLAVRLAVDGRVAALTSILTFVDEPFVRATVRRHGQSLENEGVAMQSGLAETVRHRLGAIPRMEARALDTRIPGRTTRGPLDFGLPASRLAGERSAWHRSADFPFDATMRFELVNHVDGKRHVTAIRDRLSLAFGPLPEDAVARYLEDLVSLDLLEWVEPVKKDGDR